MNTPASRPFLTEAWLAFLALHRAGFKTRRRLGGHRLRRRARAAMGSGALAPCERVVDGRVASSTAERESSDMYRARAEKHEPNGLLVPFG
jgi:hypothetical protein